jgi:hypothetical protein
VISEKSILDNKLKCKVEMKNEKDRLFVERIAGMMVSK